VGLGSSIEVLIPWGVVSCGLSKREKEMKIRELLRWIRTVKVDGNKG